MSFSEPYGEDLCENTLQQYLKDPTFVEYFNSFLLLPAFTSHVFYNSDTGYFEQVHGDGVRVGWGEGGVTPSTSLATLYLSDDTVGPSLDKAQCWLWVLQHRLPLFLRSDLYSEYKLCKILTSTRPEANSSSTRDKKQCFASSSSLTLKRQMIEERDCTPAILDVNSSTTALPSILAKEMDPKMSHSDLNIANTSPLTSLINRSQSQVHVSSPPATRINASKSDIQLGHASSSSRLTPQYDLPKRHRSISLMDVPLAHLKSSISDTHLTATLSVEDLKLLGTKSGMGSLWRFLRGKAGEKNWLFWLDAERIKYYSKPIDQQRLIRELRERYLHAGCRLELPAETRRKLRVTRSARLSLTQLTAIQTSLAQALRDYWCPRFILHHKHEKSLPTLPPSHHHTLYRSYSTTPVALQSHTHRQPNSPTLYGSINDKNYPKVSSPLVPTQTPTFRKLPPTGLSNAPTQSSKFTGGVQELKKTTFHTNTINENSLSSAPSLEAIRPGLSSHRPHTVPDTKRLPSGETLEELTGASLAIENASKSSSSGRLDSRRVWAKPGWESGTKVDSKRSVSRNRAKYTLHHLPDPSSRCASSLDSPEKQAMCSSRCQILSVAGTPLHTLTPHPSHPHTPTSVLECDSALYTPLLRCLSTEQRQAGGYFQQHLENMDSKEPLHCLLFWRELQAYKALFVVPAFSPCAVEMKAKALYARFISEVGGESINYPGRITEEVSSSLWPAYEDLFDQAEEHALATLLREWVEFSISEERLFQTLEVAPPSRHSSARTGSRRGLTSDLVGLEDLDEEDVFLDYDDDGAEREEGDGLGAMGSGNTSPPKPRSGRSRPPSRMKMGVATPSMLAGARSLQSSTPQLQEQTQAISLNDIIDNPTELEYFKVFLNENYAAQDLMCWMEIEAFRGIPISDKHVRNIKAKQLRSRYFTKKYFFGPSGPANKEAQRQVVQAGGGAYGSKLPARPRTPVFREAQKHIRGRLEKKWLANFITTPEFLERNGALRQQMSKVSKSQNGQPTYEKTFANSHGAILFRRALQDKETREVFVRYLMAGTHSSTKFPQQNIDFWLEVQRYKEMYHAHTTDHMLKSKLRAIVDCYFQSPAPPRLQLDIPQTIADQCTKKERGPYVFREAQAAVFKHLYYCWQDYENFSSGCTGQEIESAIEKLVSQIRASELAFTEKAETDLDLKKLSVPRFETVAEREERLQREKELAEFGKVAVAFRLSTPNPRYKYYTDLPEDFIEAEDIEASPSPDLEVEAQPGTSLAHRDRGNQRSQQQRTTSSKPTDPSSSPSQHRTKHSTNKDALDSPTVVVKMQRNSKPSNSPVLRKETSTDFQQQIRETLPIRPDNSNQELLLLKQSGSHYYNDRKTVKPASVRSRKQLPVKAKTNPNTATSKVSTR